MMLSLRTSLLSVTESLYEALINDETDLVYLVIALWHLHVDTPMSVVDMLKKKNQQ